MKADFTGSFLNASNTKDGDIFVIIGKPENEEKEGTFGFYVQTNMQVEINGVKKTYTPSKDSGLRMQRAWGDEMDNWVGKKAQIKQVMTKIKGELKNVIEAFPIIEEKI